MIEKSHSWGKTLIKCLEFHDTKTGLCKVLMKRGFSDQPMAWVGHFINKESMYRGLLTRLLWTLLGTSGRLGVFSQPRRSNMRVVRPGSWWDPVSGRTLMYVGGFITEDHDTDSGQHPNKGIRGIQVVAYWVHYDGRVRSSIRPSPRISWPTMVAKQYSHSL